MAVSDILINDVFNTCRLHFKNGDIVCVDLAPYENFNTREIIYSLCGGKKKTQFGVSNFSEVAHVLLEDGNHYFYLVKEVCGFEFGFDPDISLRFKLGEE